MTNDKLQPIKKFATMTPHSIGYVVVLFFVLSTTSLPAQQVYAVNPDSATVFPTKHGAFENYVFILDGKAIDQDALVDFPGAKLNNVFPYTITLEGRSYSGAVYFHTQERYAPPVRDTDDLAYFINGKQVSPFHFLRAEVEAYYRIGKSPRDTSINGRLYKGSISVHTDEDFFAERTALPELIRSYTGLSPEKVIVHWRGTNYRYTDEEEIGTIIRDHFPMYYFKIKKRDTIPDVADRFRFDIRAVEVDRIRFAEGERYVVHLVDPSYRRSTPKGRLLFEDPLAVDTVAPCYVTDFDNADDETFANAEIGPKPCLGKDCETDYLKKLSADLGLPADIPQVTTTPDSITVQFIVLRDGMLTALECDDLDKPGHEDVLNAIKKRACVWQPGLMSGRPVITARKIKIYYRRDENSNIMSLDNLVYLPVKNKKP